MEIKGLYKLQKKDQEKLIGTFEDAFVDYPKLMAAFPNENTKAAALEATLRFYVAYDMEFGDAFSLDKEIHEGVCVVHSDEMHYTEERYIQAGSYSDLYQAAMTRLTKEEQRRRTDLFDELDRLEEQIELPEPHLYVDFLGVKQAFQKQGRGRKLMNAVCHFAEEEKLPLMLFTNTAEDVEFYKSLGFRVVGTVHSDQFGFTNTYLVKEA